MIWPQYWGYLPNVRGALKVASDGEDQTSGSDTTRSRDGENSPPNNVDALRERLKNDNETFHCKQE